MYPVNQVFLGNSDPLLSQSDITSQMQILKQYSEITASLQQMVQVELLNLVKAKIESNSEGKDLLQRQLKLVKKLKNKIVEETDNEMAIFKKFREFSKDNPGLTYEEFIKQWRST